MLAFLGRLLGPALIGWLAQFFGQRQRDKLVVRAADAKRAEDALAKNKEAAIAAAKMDEDIARASAADLDSRLRRFSRKPKP